MSGEQDRVAGAVKEFEGKISGDKVRESEGTAQQAAGRVKGAVGVVADRPRALPRV